MDRGTGIGRFASGTVFVLVAGLHLAAFLYITVNTGTRELRDEADVFKLVDVREYVPPPPPPSLPKPKPKEEVVETPPQETIAETVIETEKIVVETPAVEPPSPPPPVSRDPEYLPQHKISKPPGIPQDRIRANIVYPPLANRQRIEGVVYLELFIDREGVIRKIDVLRDPGYGLAEAAVAAFRGITCTPAEANGEPVAVRYRYPIRFQLR